MLFKSFNSLVNELSVGRGVPSIPKTSVTIKTPTFEKMDLLNSFVLSVGGSGFAFALGIVVTIERRKRVGAAGGDKGPCYQVGQNFTSWFGRDKARARMATGSSFKTESVSLYEDDDGGEDRNGVSSPETGRMGPKVGTVREET
ncbi:hypothetical protein GH714_024537 [Hevea brasiliensis]|uniref:Uncharacterized protein n=1 Tax=Hevea brasiliensis TaxID=3981 RepID=A0A6A6MCS7_HEVBR|nr:hypothetical protein GH714_024537 [Hevea brasiliensis]